MNICNINPCAQQYIQIITDCVADAPVIRLRMSSRLCPYVSFASACEPSSWIDDSFPPIFFFDFQIGLQTTWASCYFQTAAGKARWSCVKRSFLNFWIIYIVNNGSPVWRSGGFCPLSSILSRNLPRDLDARLCTIWDWSAFFPLFTHSSSSYPHPVAWLPCSISLYHVHVLYGKAT